MDQKQIEEMKKRVDQRAVASITNILKLHGFNYLGLSERFRKVVIAIYQQGEVDILEEIVNQN